MTVILSKDAKTLTIKAGTRFIEDIYQTIECEIVKDITIEYNPHYGEMSGEYKFLINGINKDPLYIKDAYKNLSDGNTYDLQINLNSSPPSSSYVANTLNCNSSSIYWNGSSSTELANGIYTSSCYEDYSPDDIFRLSDDSNVIIEQSYISNIEIEGENYIIKDILGLRKGLLQKGEKQFLRK